MNTSGTILPCCSGRNAKPRPLWRSLLIVALAFVGLVLIAVFAPKAGAEPYALSHCEPYKGCVWRQRFDHAQDCLDEIERQTRVLPSGTVLRCSTVKNLGVAAGAAPFDRMQRR